MHLQNGDPTKEIYLGQYFDKAYKANSDGTRSTTESGILSEYGEFFPTEPGRVILTTKPDIDTGEQGECTVHVIGLSIDANHDSNMNESFTGPDVTYSTKPLVFWENNDFDRWHTIDLGTDSEEDDLGPKDLKELPARERVPDSQFVSALNIPVIASKRDMEDYTRLWLSGFSELMSTLPNDCHVDLNWRDPAGSNPEIRIFRAVEADGATGYLSMTKLHKSNCRIPATAGLSAR
jgi:hypothetical protein